MRNLILLTGFVTTLIVWTSLADPIAVPKMFVLTILSAWILGTIVVRVFSNRYGGFSMGQWAVSGFALCMLIAALTTDLKYTAFFGAIQRNDGAISYIALASLSFSAMMSFSFQNVRQVRNWILVLGLLLTSYGLIQTFGYEPLKWVLLYNPIVGTLGNPDFFSGIVGAIALGSVWLIMVEKGLWIRGAGVALLLLELFVLKRSGSIQGIAAFSVGLAVILVTRIWQFQKRIGIASSIIAGIVSITVFLGFLNTGPLASHLYRGSIRSRLDYWHAAVKMFNSHPLVGIGLDRFGENYGQYVSQIQIIQGQPSDNAHSVFLQLAATGGLLVILPYLFLLFVILVAAIRAIKGSTGQKRLDIVALFSIWLALLLVSAISIDNLGVAVWFWILGGVLYGVSWHQRSESRAPLGKQKSGKTKKGTSSDNSILLAPILSLALSILMLLVVVPAWKSSALLLNIQRHTSGLTKIQFVNYIDQAANAQPSNVPVHVMLADLALRISAFDTGLRLIKSINEQDPRSINGNNLGAIAYEMQKDFQSAIPYRQRLLKIDPWNTKNMLQLVTDYLAIKDFAKARELSSRLMELYPNAPDTKSAQALVKG